MRRGIIDCYSWERHRSVGRGAHPDSDAPSCREPRSSPPSEGRDTKGRSTSEQSPPRRTRVLCLNHRDPLHPRAGGAERYLWEVLSRLDPKRYAVTWRSEAVRGRPKLEQMGPIRVVRRGGRVAFQLLAPFVAGGFDLVIESVAHAVPFHTGFTHRGPRLIILYHVHQAVLGRELPWGIAVIARFLERTVRFESGTFLAISETTRDEARRTLGVSAPIDVIPPGVDHGFYRPGGERSVPPNFLCLGRLRRYKRVDTAIAAFATLPEPGTLTIVGEGEDRARLEKVTHNVRGVRFTGSVPEEEKLRLLQGATALVAASEAEGFGLTVLEAGAVATPTVAVDRPVFREVVEDRVSGVLVAANDVPSMASGLRWARDHPELREGARAFALRFDWETTADRFSRLVERTVRPPVRPVDRGPGGTE